jgi:hypothetical protein
MTKKKFKNKISDMAEVKISDMAEVKISDMTKVTWGPLATVIEAASEITRLMRLWMGADFLRL